MKKHFITGLILLLPLTLTIVIIHFLFNLLTEPFLGVVRSILNYYNLFSDGFLFLNADETQILISRLLILGLLFFITLFLGLITRVVFVNYFIDLWDKLLNRIPLVRSLYKISQDVTKTIFSPDATSFKKVVLVPFPSSESLSLGFITREGISSIPTRQGHSMVSVFVPTTPNPTSGFLMFFKEEELISVEMSVEDAFKYVISCGVIEPAFSLKNEKVLTKI